MMNKAAEKMKTMVVNLNFYAFNLFGVASAKILKV